MSAEFFWRLGIAVAKGLVFFGAIYVFFWSAYNLGRSDTEYTIGKRWYLRCREGTGQFDPMLTLQKDGRSSCAQRFEGELGFQNRWPEEFR